MDYPLDLYYVLDLSLSMQDDLEILKVRLKIRLKKSGNSV